MNPRNPPRGIAAQAARGLIRAYQLTFSAIFGRECRYLPTCSEYAAEAIARHGLWAGCWMAAARLARCNPWGASGFDPVPGTAGAPWYRPWAHGRWTGRHIKLRLDEPARPGGRPVDISRDRR